MRNLSGHEFQNDLWVTVYIENRTKAWVPEGPKQCLSNTVTPPTKKVPLDWSTVTLSGYTFALSRNV